MYYPDYQYDAYDMEYIMQRRNQHPSIYTNTLYRQVDEDRHSGLSSLLSRVNKPAGGSYPTTLYNYNAPRSGFLNHPIVSAIIHNPIGMILIVVIISYLLALIGGNLLGMDAGITGLVELVVALALSYGLALYTERNSDFVIKGTFVFFISLIILIILIFV